MKSSIGVKLSVIISLLLPVSLGAQMPETKPIPQINPNTIPPIATPMIPALAPETQPETQPQTQPETRSAAPAESRPAYYKTLGGDSYETAVLIPVGEELRLVRSQAPGKYDYFVIDLKPAQLLTISLSVGETASDLFLFGAAGEALGQVSFAGEKNLRKSIEIDSPTPQRLYLLWGSAMGEMNKDEASLKLDVKNLYDIGRTSDAGATIEEALPLEKGKFYPESYLLRSDVVDFYKIPTTSGENLKISLTPQNPKAILSAGLYDEIKTELGRGRSALPGGSFFVTGVSRGSNVYLQVTRDAGGEPTAYKIEFSESRSAETLPASGAVKPGIETTTPVTTKKELSREDRLKPKVQAKKVPFWKDTKLMTIAGGGLAGVLVLALGASVLMRKSRRKREDELN